MGVNQVKFGDATVMDISDSTVAPETLLSGVTAYNKAGNKITGEVVVEHVEVEPVLETGTKSATITVGEESTDIYCENTKAEVKNMKSPLEAGINDNTAIFDCIDKNFLKSLVVDIPVSQDFNGYERPWPAGKWNNKMPPLTVGTYTQGGITAVVTADGKVTVTGQKTVSGSVSIDIPFEKSFDLSSATYIHVRNSISSSNITLDWGVGGWYFAMAPVNRIIAPNDNVGVTRLRLYHSSAVTEQLNYTLQLSIETSNSITDWTPYENDCPLNSCTELDITKTGKNLFNKDATYTTPQFVNVDGNTIEVEVRASGGTFYYNENPMNIGGKTITISSQVNGTYPRVLIRLRKLDDSGWMTNEDVTLSGWQYNAYYNGWYVNASFPMTREIPNCLYANIGIGSDSNTSVGIGHKFKFTNFQVELGSTATDFEPYAYEKIQIDLKGRRYGCKLNVLTGELIINTAFLMLSDVVNKITIRNTATAGIARGTFTPSPAIRLSKTIKDVFVWSNILEGTNPYCSYGNYETRVEYCINGDMTTKVINFFASDIQTAAGWKAFATENEVEICYELDNPITIYLSKKEIKTFKGQNIITVTPGLISECSYRVLEENLSDTIYSNETLVGEDSDVYTFRTTPDISDANYVEENIVGGSVVWNQLAKAFTDGNLPSSSSDNWYATTGTATASSGICTLTPSARYGRINQYIPYVANRKILIKVDVKLSNSTNADLVNASAYGLDMVAGGIARTRCAATTEWQTISFICYSTTSSVNNRLLITDTRASDWGTIQVKNYVCHDLTAMFGSAVADYIYSLENTTAGAGVAFLQKYGFLTRDYYDYNTGSLQSVNFNKWFKTSKNLFNLHRLQGVTTNIIDGNDVYVRLTKNSQQHFHDYQSYIPGNRTYTLQFDPPSDLTWTYASVRCRLKDNSDFGNVGAIDGWSYQNLLKIYTKSFENASHAEITATVPDCLYCEFGIGTNNLSGNINVKETGTYVKFSNIQLEVGSVATDYEPYEGYEISLDDNLDLRGLFKIVDNELVADGDIYEGDGKITRKYGVVDLGDFTWVKHSTEGRFYTQFSSADNAKPTSSTSVVGNILCLQYSASSQNNLSNGKISIDANPNPYINIIDLAKSDLTAEDFKTAMSGIKLLYELAEPILNRGTNFDSPQVFIPNGNEYFVKTYASTPDRDIDIPAGHDGKYYGKSMFKEISLPTIPKSGGTYILKCNVLADGNKKLYWCADGD